MPSPPLSPESSSSVDVVRQPALSPPPLPRSASATGGGPQLDMGIGGRGFAEPNGVLAPAGPPAAPAIPPPLPTAPGGTGPVGRPAAAAGRAKPAAAYLT